MHRSTVNGMSVQLYNAKRPKLRGVPDQHRLSCLRACEWISARPRILSTCVIFRRYLDEWV